jgi:hypothetical protein
MIFAITSKFFDEVELDIMPLEIWETKEENRMKNSVKSYLQLHLSSLMRLS